VDVLVVKKDEEKEVLIPLAREMLKRIDFRSGILTVEPPEGLLEINEI
jgi:ribosomal 30S subunit maturation factor RimM